MPTMTELRQDWDALQDDDRIVLFPRPDNPIQSEPEGALYASGYFYLDGRNSYEAGPDYYFGDVATFCEGFILDN